MLDFLLRFLRGRRPGRVVAAPSRHTQTQRVSPATPRAQHGGEGPAGGSDTAPPEVPAAQRELLELLDGKGHFQHTLSGREEAVLSAVGQRVESGDLVLPVLPATSLAAMDMASRPSAEVADVARLIAGDPVLSSELLKTSNSVLYAGSHKCETLHEAVMRIGLRALRSMIFSISMRAVLLRDKTLAHISEELWRQAHSVSLMARALAPLVGMDRERAFLIGLLHDIGKLALLETVRQESSDIELRPALLGRVFYLHHERAGERLARAWMLPDELVSVAGQHHRFERNGEHGRSAALASLAHALDLHLTVDGVQHAGRLLERPELDFLGIETGRRQQLLDAVLGVWSESLAAAA